MIIKLNNWINDVHKHNIVYPIKFVPKLPAGLLSITLNNETELIEWINEFVLLYNEDGIIKLKEQVKYSIMRIYNTKYIEATIKVVDSIDKFRTSN